MVLYFQNCTVGSSNLSYDFISSQTSGWDLTSFKMDGEMGTLITHNEDVNCVIFSGCCLQQIPLSHFERCLTNVLGLEYRPDPTQKSGKIWPNTNHS